MPAEAERVREHGVHVLLPGYVGYVVEIAVRVRVLVVNGGMDNPLSDRSYRSNRLDRPRPAERGDAVPGDRGVVAYGIGPVLGVRKLLEQPDRLRHGQRGRVLAGQTPAGLADTPDPGAELGRVEVELELAAGGGTYDVVWTTHRAYRRWAANDWIFDIYPFIKDPKRTDDAKFDFDDYLKGVIGALTVDGKL